MSGSLLSTSKTDTINPRLMWLRPGFLLRLWVIARLPLFVAALYFIWPDEFIWLATISAIHLIGTAPERLVIFLFIGLFLGGSFILAGKLPGKPLRFLMPVGLAFGLFWGLFYAVPGLHPLGAALFLTGVLAVNTLSADWLTDFISRNHPVVNLIFGLILGLSELLLLKPLLVWLPVRWQASKVSWGRWPALLLVPGLAAFLLNPYSLSDLHRSLWPDSAVRLVARENFSWTELDLNQRMLYAVGYGTNYLQAYNIDLPGQPPLISPVENGYAQGFAYNPLGQEIYIYNVLNHNLLTLDAKSLALKQTLATLQLSPGDVWVAWDPFSDSLVLASEADEQAGVPTMMVDRATGRILNQLDLDPGNIALHPNKPWLYMSFLRRINELVIYDLEQQRIIKRAPAPERLDRMIFVPGEGGLELLASAPLNSAVIRFDAETLERRKTIPTLFGGRAIAVDARRNLLLCGSLVTHRLEVIDLTSQRRVGDYYLGPWLRTIVLDPDRGVAYVSSHGGLFTVQYTDKQSQ